MGRSRIRIHIMRTDLERNQAQRFKAHGLDNWHVFRSFETRTGNNRSGAGADIKRPTPNSVANRFNQLVLLKFMQQSERVPPTNKNNLRQLDCSQSVRNVVGRRKFKPHLGQAAFGLCTVCPPIMKCIRDEYDPSTATDEISDFSLDMIEVAPTVHGRVTNQQES